MINIYSLNKVACSINNVTIYLVKISLDLIDLLADIFLPLALYLFFLSHFVTNIVVLNVNILHLSIIDKIISEGNKSLVVTFEKDRSIY